MIIVAKSLAKSPTYPDVVPNPHFVTVIMASAVELQDFIDRQRILLAKERGAEIERTSLLLSNCGPKILEQKGLSLGGLGVVGMHIGLGGKTYASLIKIHM